MTNQKRNELIAIATLAVYSTGDCGELYDKDVLKECDMSSEEMGEFLSHYSATIDRVSANLFNTIVNQVVIGLL